jgi:signal peptidase I
MAQQRKPWLAAMANFVVPGLGFLYAGSLSMALTWPAFLLMAGLLAVAVVLWVPLRPLNAILFWLLVPLSLVVGPLLGWRDAGRVRHSFQPTRWNRAWIYLVYSLVLIGASNAFLSYVVRPHLLEAFRNPSGSMEPTLLIGDYLFVDKFHSRAAQRDRPVVFESVEEPGLKVMKRIAAIAGDTIAATDSGIVVNGKRPAVLADYHVDAGETLDTFSRRLLAGLKQRYAPQDTTTWHLGAWGPLVVPPGHFFVLGDNENASYDSRYYGPVPDHHILGWPHMIYLSYDTTGVRWARIGRRIR